MGCSGSKDAVEEELAKVDKQVLKDAKVKVDVESKIRKVLLLGPGEAGKSTFLKQMIINNRGGFSESDRKIAAGIIRSNIVDGIRDIVSFIQKEGSELHLAEESKVLAESLAAIENTEKWTPDLSTVKSAVMALWGDDAVQAVWKRRVEVAGLNENLEYFISRLDSVAKSDYIPTNADMLFSRLRTIGVQREMFELKGKKMELIDVGGQKNERRKWINLFDEVTAILFLVAVSEYDQLVWEDEKTNRIEDAISLFGEIANNPLLKDVPICVFMNKSDLFEKKIKSVSLKVAFPEWDESKDSDLDAAYTFLEDKFKKVCKFKDKKMTFFQTTATNSDNVKALWADIELQILNRNLEQL